MTRHRRPRRDRRANRAGARRSPTASARSPPRPMCSCDVDRARAYTGIAAEQGHRISWSASAQGPNVDAGAPTQLRRQHDRRRGAHLRRVPRVAAARFWLFGTGAGAALFAGALLGVIVGTVIVAQTLYSSTKDHLNEFATLRAIGSSSSYIHKVIICQALIERGDRLWPCRRRSGWIVALSTADIRAADRHHAGADAWGCSLLTVVDVRRSRRSRPSSR